jgi:hypothetical protein
MQTREVVDDRKLTVLFTSFRNNESWMYSIVLGTRS